MGANLANEIASEAFSEATIGCDDANMGSILKELMQTPYFRVAISDDKEGVEICGALKVCIHFTQISRVNASNNF